MNRSPGQSAKVGRPGQAPTEDTLSLVPMWWTYFPVALVAFLGILITNGAFLSALEREKNEVEAAFDEAAHDRIQFVQREVDQALTIVQDLASFFEASTAVGRREYRKFVGPVLKRHAGIKALKWVSVVSAEGRADFVGQARQSFPPFKLSELTASGRTTDISDRPVYYPVLYVQPYQENKTLLGLDVGTDPVISTLLRQAEQTGTARVSPAIPVDSLDGGGQAIVVTIPVFFEGEDLTDEEAESTTRIRGFALGQFRIKDLVERSLANLWFGGIDIHIYQYLDNGAQRHVHSHWSRLRQDPAPDPEPTPAQLTVRQDISFGGQRWSLVCTPAPGQFEREIRTSWIILAAGLAFTALLTTYLITLVGQARRIRQEVDLRTTQLRATVQELNREVAERKSAEQELQDLNETLELHIANRTAEAERKAQYLEQFAYVASHDLKAPLRAVSNLAGWIEEDLSDRLDDKSREQLVLLRDRVQRMHNLIEGLLEYSRVGKTSDAESLVDVRELIIEVIDSLSPPKGFKIKVPQQLPTLYADRLQLGQVFSNLISNSIKHHGGDRGKVRIQAEYDGGLCEFCVCDDGKGIAPEYHNKIFMIFQTLAAGDFENSTGIGLALVKKIVEENGGSIRVESNIGEGACFCFTWPNQRSVE